MIRDGFGTEYPNSDPLVMAHQLAQLESMRHFHEYIDLPHFVLALVRVNRSVARQVFDDFGIHPQDAEAAMLKEIPS
jgi:ATP-dependent Clp protease ATP-binding subunit ClpA